MNDGGPAFPKTGNYLDGQESHYDSVDQDGMSLRDYFAVHADQPGQSEIGTLLGWKVSGMTTSWDDPEGKPFNVLWAGLSNKERLEASATVRYQMADAMLKARES